MLTFLRDIAEVILNIPQYILYVIENGFNILMEGITAIFTAAVSLIPLPGEPSPPEFIQEINWFFPIGSLISIATPIVIGYSAFLLVRWIFVKAGDL